MNIIERGRAFAQALRQVAGRSVWDWRRCPRCGDTLTCRWGSYVRHPWLLKGRQAVAVRRHKCNRCSAAIGKLFTYSERSALLVKSSWYAREVHRFAIDHWQHTGSSLRRTAELLRSLLGHQERWQLWCPWQEQPPVEKRCHLSQSTVQRWLKRAGEVAKGTVAGQLTAVAHSGQMGADGLWVRLREGARGIVLMLVDTISGLIYPPVVVESEDSEEEWKKLFERARQAGLRLDELLGLVSDGARGLGVYLKQLYWVNHQRCVFHLWGNLSGALGQGADAAVEGLSAEVSYGDSRAAKALRRAMRQELVGLVRQVLDAPSLEQAHSALEALAAHQYGQRLAQLLKGHVEEALVYRKEDNRGLARVGPEWCWRDFRLRLSRGRNQGSDDRLERGALVWAIYHNFEPAQVRSERKRKYRRAGLSALAMSGQTVVGFSYLDALAV